MTRLFPLLLLLALLLPAAAGARPSQITFFEAPRELRSDDAALRASTLDDIRALGVRHLRMNLFWRDAAPQADSAVAPQFDATDPGGYDWGLYDRVLGEARARGLQLMLTISGPVPRWATRARRDNLTRPDPERFEAFATAAGRRYRDLVDRWSIYNEPNLPAFLRPQYRRGKVVSGAIYRDLYLAGRRGLRASGNGGDTILVGETAPFGTSKTAAPLAFMRNMLGLKRSYEQRRGVRKLPADGWAHHPYTSSAGPRFKPNDRDDVTIGTLRRLTRALDKAARSGAIRRRLPIWITEFGIQSKPDPLAVGQAKQAHFRSIAERIAFKNRRVRSFAQYLMRDDLPRTGAGRFGGFESGLRRSGGRAKRAFEDFRLPLTATRKGRTVRLWGLVRPASGRTRVTVEVRRGGDWKRAGVRRTRANGSWTLRSGFTRGVRYRVSWRDFTGPAVKPLR